MSWQEIILHLGLIEKVGLTYIAKLVEQLGHERIEQVYNFSSADFQTLGLSEQKAQNLVDGLRNQALLARELDLMRQHNVGFVTLWCPEYPAILKEIHVPPLVLYYQGDVALFAHQKNIACVGSRKAHRYVYETLVHLVAPMIRDGWLVVSGGALGADTYAHQLALDQGSTTIVVVGSGLCHLYPPSNKKLFENVISRGGLIVSCFPMQIPPEPHCFPIRNRLISGLSRGCIVLQAAAKSGALITAESALAQGREVFAVPGPIFDPLSAGCHGLIQQGAKLITCTQDILEELEYDLVNTAQLRSVPLQQGLFQPEVTPAVSPAVSPAVLDKFDELTQQVLQAASVPITVDLLLSKLQIDLDALQNKLFELSLDGKISQDAMGFWKRV